MLDQIGLSEHQGKKGNKSDKTQGMIENRGQQKAQNVHACAVIDSDH